MYHIQKSGRKIAMLVANNKGNFTKKATGRITFTCNDGHLLEEAHQKTIDQQEAKLKKDGFTETRREVKVNTPNGEKSKRYIDLEGKNPKTGEVKQIQVGKQNKNGTPVARERRAINDIKTATGKKPDFVPYNN
jgi:hypothetical protein